MSIKESVRRYVIDNFLFGKDELKDDDSFLEMKIMDSTGVLEMVSYLEETFGITVEDEEIIPENLDTVELIVAYVERKGGVPD